MVCQNCQSKDVIKVQEQLFCVNCGNLVVPARSETTVVVAPATDGLPDGVTILPVPMVEPVVPVIPKRRRPGRPKAGPIDAVRAMVPTNPVTGEALGVAVMNDVTQSPARGPILSARKAAGHTESVAFNDLMSASVHGRFNHTHWVLALVPAIILAFVAAFVVTVLGGDVTAVERLIPQGAAVAVGGQALITFLVYYLSRSYMQAAIIYGASRQADHRPAPLRRWLDVAARSTGARLRFDVLSSLLQLGVIGLIASLLVTGGSPWRVPEMVQLAILFGAFLMLSYILTGLVLAQGLGHVAVTLGALNARQAYGIGWGFFRNHFELIGIKIVTILIEVVLVVPVIAAVLAVILLYPNGNAWPVTLAVSAGVAIVGASTGAASAIWWQAAYRRLVRTDRLSEATKLLAGRTPAMGKRHATAWFMAALALIAVVGAAWPWIAFPR